MAQKWEYLRKDWVANSEWATLGEQGWELVLNETNGGSTVGYILKRP